MSLQSWEEALYSTVVDATAISNSTSEAIMVPDFAIPAKYWYPGRTLKATMYGLLSNIVTTPGTLTLRSRWGGVAGTVLVASSAIALNAAAQTSSECSFEFLLTCRAVGISATSGTLFTSGKGYLGNSRGTTQGLVDMFPASGNAAVGSLDLTSAGTLSFTAQFSIGNSGNNLTINQYTLESLN